VVYRGRFAPSPTGPLHAGSLLAALASWLDARAQGGIWLVRIEDTDTPRCPAGTGDHILWQLARCGLVPDAPPVWQSQRLAHYQGALERLRNTGAAYPCGCSRSDIAQALLARGHDRARHADLRYPGTCRDGLLGKAARAWRMRLPSAAPAACVHWDDRRLGPQSQDVAQAVGDFVLLRADGYVSYQLAVVVDDAAQGITDIVRGADLTDNTARQIALQRALQYPTPRYLHTPLVLADDGQKLSKQNGAAALDTESEASILRELGHAAIGLGLLPLKAGDNQASALSQWTAQWKDLYLSTQAVPPDVPPAPII
jgi:glutamyl-Q tRNA(Asp) synthetase